VKHFEKINIKICIISFLMIFSFMYYFEKSFIISETEISNLDISKINQFVKVSGVIESQNLYNENLFVNLCSDFNKNNINKKISCIKLILFDIESKLDQNFKYEVIGKVTYYNNNLEIIVRKIEIE
jgi:hypothetical protein